MVKLLKLLLSSVRSQSQPVIHPVYKYGQGHGKFIEAYHIVPKGGGYQERDARFSVLDPEHANAFVRTTRLRTQMLMERRGEAIEAGLVHLTPAARRNMGDPHWDGS